MKSQIARIDVAPGYAPDMFPARPQNTAPSFKNELGFLYADTRALAGNVISLHLHLAEQNDQPDDTAVFLSRFQQDLTGHAVALQRHIETLQGTPPLIQERVERAAIWRLTEVADVSTALKQLFDATDALMELYGGILPAAVRQCDHAVSYYLLAGQLAALNGYWRGLDYALQVKRMTARPFV